MDVLKMINEAKTASEVDKIRIETALQEYSTIDLKYFIHMLLNNMPKKGKDYILVRTIISYYNEGKLNPYGICELFYLYSQEKYDFVLHSMVKDSRKSDFRREPMPNFRLAPWAEELNLLPLGNGDAPVLPTEEMMAAAQFIQKNSLLSINQPFFHQLPDISVCRDSSNYPPADRVQLFTSEGTNIVTSKDYDFVLNNKKYEWIFIELLDYIDSIIKKQQQKVATPERINQIRMLDSLNPNEKRMLISALREERAKVDTPYTLTKKNLQI